MKEENQEVFDQLLRANAKVISLVLERLTKTTIDKTEREKCVQVLSSMAQAEHIICEFLVNIDPSFTKTVNSYVEPSLLAKAQEIESAKIASRPINDTASNKAMSGPSYAVGVNVKVVYCCADGSYAGLAPSLAGWTCADNIPCDGCLPYA